MNKCVFLAIALSSLVAAAAESVLYQNDFNKLDVGKVPEELLVLDGGFAVQEIDGNKVLQLPGAPLETFGVLFGPSEQSGLRITARIHGTKKGRREPAFAVGLNGNAGFRMQVSASKKMLELFKGDNLVAKAPFTWESGSWTMMKLQVRKTGESEFTVEGKAWKQGGAEPDKWLVTYSEKPEAGSELIAGRASVWGNPFAGTPIDFDDLVVTKL
jgi:hypothetical protein